MSNKILNKCPACGEELVASTLKCNGCGIEIKGEFAIPTGDSKNDSPLNTADMAFLKVFLKYEGNISKVQNELGLGYSSIKSRLREINIKLGNKEEDEIMEDIEDSIEVEGLGSASQIIAKKLEECGGSAECPMLRGEPLKIWLTSDGVRNSGFPTLICEWKIFDAIVEKAKELGGKMYRGDGASQSGAKIGSDALPLDTIDSFISVKFYGKKVGESTLRRSTYYCAILAWAGICENKRSDGIGGYIELIK